MTETRKHFAAEQKIAILRLLASGAGLALA